MFHNPHVNFTLLASEYISDKVQSLEELEEKLIDVDHLICFSHSCTLQSNKVALNLLWENDSQNGFAQIYRVSSDRSDRSN